MDIKRTLEDSLKDFRVEERVQFPGDRGAYSYYRVEKHNMTTVRVRKAMAAQLGVVPSAINFPAVKDMPAVTVQYASVRKLGPAQFKGQGYVAHRVQRGPRALRVGDLSGNVFTFTVRNLSKTSAETLPVILKSLEDHGLPNYYDDRRFGSLSQQGFIGKAVLMGDAEKVVRLYLAEPMLGDLDQIREFKALVKSHWGQWGYLLHKAPRPSNYRSVLVYLKDHPHNYEKAANLIRDRRLASYLQAYQSWVWNHILANAVKQTTSSPMEVDIAGSRFPLPKADDETLIALQDTTIQLPILTANYQGQMANAAKAALAIEGLEINDFNPRLLRRVCLSKGRRKAIFAPTEVTTRSPVVDPENPDHRAIKLSFTLPIGHYATLVMKAAAVRLRHIEK